MNLLGSILYDPAAAVNKVTTAAIAMTALDTTNLRIAFTIPAHGRVRVRLAGVIHGATTCPQIMLGVLEGSTVRGRVAPMVGGSNLAATSLYKVEADYVISGLTPGAVNWDAAYGVETLVAATGLKYGGPNNTTANDNFGGFVFEIWDVMPHASVHTKLDIIDDFLDTEVAAIKAKTDNLPASPANEATLTTISGLIDTEVAAIKAKTDNLPTDPADASDIAASFTTVNTKLDTIDGRIDTEVGAIKAKTDNIPTDPADASDIAAAFGTVNGTLTTIATYIDTEVGAIKAKTDNLPASPAATGDIPSASAIADGVWDEAIAGHLSAGTAGLALNSAGGAGDPWSTALPGAYGSGTAGKILGDNLNQTVSSRASQTSVDDLPTNSELATALEGIELTPTERTAIANGLLDLAAGVETGLTLRQALRLLVASNAGKLSGAGNSTITIRNFGDDKNRITATVDANGNRSAVVYDLT